MLVLVSDIDALYDAPPSQAGAKAIHEVAKISDIDSLTLGGAGSAGVGSGGMVTKVEAARISTSAGIAMLLTSLEQSGETLAGSPLGTLFHAQANKSNSRMLWLAHASTPQGRLVLDAGAVTAILERGVSLLPAGVTAIGDPDLVVVTVLTTKIEEVAPVVAAAVEGEPGAAPVDGATPAPGAAPAGDAKPTA